jgi:glycosyltransferase involved in cell wall biosynthesis
MKVCVIICSYNRAAILRDTLASFMTLKRPSDLAVELLIVDNNSTDKTPEVADEFCMRAPELVRKITERTPGLSFARNAGIRATDADVIVFVDDDVYFEPDWLVEITRLFRENSEVMCVGGQSVPLFEGGAPSWISTPLLKIYGATNSGDVVKRMQFPEHPFGLNMAFRREVFDRVGMFDTNLGRIKNSLLSNEETDLFHRINQAQLAVFYTPYAVLKHRIPRSRAQKRWVLQRYYWQGVSDIAFAQKVNPETRGQLLCRARWTFQNHMLTLLREQLMSLWVRGSETQRFSRWTRCWYHAGAIRQLVREATKPAPPMNARNQVAG